MSEFTYAFDSKSKIIYSKFIGEFSSEEILEHVTSIRNDDYFDNSYSAIVNLKKAAIPHTFTAASTIAKYLARTSKQRGEFKAAFVVGEQSVGVSDTLIALSSIEDIPIMINSFNTKQEATAWLT